MKNSYLAGTAATGRCLSIACLLFLNLLTSVDASFAQAPEMSHQKIRLFLDCDDCDFSFFRRNIAYVDYVRDPKLADLHLLVTRQFTASRGRSYKLNFLGKGEFEALTYLLSFQSPQSDTEAQRRDRLVQQVKLGLMPFVAYTDEAVYLEINYENEGSETITTLEEDPWNYWVFRMGIGASLQAQENQSAYSVNGFFRADRITELWKIRTRYYYDYNEENFDDDGEKIKAFRSVQDWNLELIRSLSERWSLGLFANAYSTTFQNIDWATRFAPAIEYNFWPWDESDRRVFSLGYYVGIRHFNYIETTLFNQNEETRSYESLRLQLVLRQPWGELESELEGLHYFHDFDRYRIVFRNSLFFRVTNGLSFSMGIEAQSVHDQLYLPAGDASLEEILLQQRQLATTFEVSLDFGIRYTFGSIYNNIVNPRF